MPPSRPPSLATTPPARPELRRPGRAAPRTWSAAPSGRSRLWFTLGFGIVNEVYYPRVDIPQIRDLGFIVADGDGFWVEVKRLANYSMRLLAPGVPAVEIMHQHARFHLRLRITPDPRPRRLGHRVSARRRCGELRPYVLLAPHLGATGYDNTASVAALRRASRAVGRAGPVRPRSRRGRREPADAFGRASAGYVGASDGWQDFDRNGALTWAIPAPGPAMSR